MQQRGTLAASTPQGPSERTALKRRELQRMQRLTLALLGVSLALLLVSVRFQSVWPWLRWVQAFAEASAIGAMADWYAVVALFRRPLGLPIPHSAIIPQHKDSIGESLGEFVARYLLTPDNIIGKLKGYDAASQLARWFAVPANAASTAQSLTGLLPSLLRAPDDADLRRFFQNSIAPQLLELNAAHISGRLVTLMLEGGWHRTAFERGLAALERWLRANEDLIKQKFAQVSKYTPDFLDNYIVRKFLQGVHALVQDVIGDPAHPLRARFDATLHEWAQTLDRSAEQREALQACLRGMLERFAEDVDLRRLCAALASRAEADLAKPDSLLQRFATALIVALAEGALRDQALLERLNAAWLTLARATASRHGGQISALIAEVVKSWDADEVGRKIELEIGTDLQFIRINGALVGGTVGVVLHACTVWLQ